MTWGPPMEDFFPFEAPPGNHSTMDNWRKMAQLWCADGVIRPHLSHMTTEANPFSVYGYDWASGRVTVAPGGCWVNGFYGESRAAKVLDVGSPGGHADGMIVVRYDNVAQNMAIVWRPGVAEGGLVKDPVGWWEIPLARMWDGHDWPTTDRRRYVPLDSLTPGIPEIPRWVPFGQYPPGAWGWAQWPPTQQDVGPGTTDLLVIYPGTMSNFRVGRSYRFTFLASPVRFTDGTGVPNAQLIAYVRDDLGVRRQENLLQQSHFANASGGQGTTVATTITITNGQPNLVAFLQLVIHNAGNIWRWPANSIVITCEDAGA